MALLLLAPSSMFIFSTLMSISVRSIMWGVIVVHLRFSHLKTECWGSHNLCKSSDKVVEDFSKTIEQHIIALLDPADKSEENENLATEMLLLITSLETLDLVKQLQLYKEQQNQRDQQIIQQLNSYKSKIAARRL
ncbi:predicted protein [Coccidioides posadasii str. Silveira]|uniref:Predicted protein n=1 Tax=Coccidioides posadasii (strain RMSCC 757 / Silveira) TaxID=443226 RepID=E9D3L0_COCPS|nr:predicted protein [Coccidioides posadasii str. Silveira]